MLKSLSDGDSRNMNLGRYQPVISEYPLAVVCLGQLSLRKRDSSYSRSPGDSGYFVRRLKISNLHIMMLTYNFLIIPEQVAILQ